MFAKIINLLLYSNLWIALAAGAMIWQTELLLRHSISPNPYFFLIVFSTLFLYALHRLVGIQKVSAFRDKGRYQVIWAYRKHIGLYAILSGLMAAYFFWQIPTRMWLSMVMPGVLALAYVLPFLGKGRRLRDLHYIKIFLIAITWAWLTVILPAIYWGHWPAIPVVLMSLERACFIFAITIPFDIRDLKVDAHTKVRTIPGRLGIKTAKYLAYLALVLMLLFAFFNYALLAYNRTNLTLLSLSALISALCVHFSDKTENDYFFTGLVDGLMTLQFGLIYLGYFFL